MISTFKKQTLMFLYSFCSGVNQRCETFRNIDLDIHPDMGMNHFTLVPMHPVVYISKSYKNMCDPHIRKPPYTCHYMPIFGWVNSPILNETPVVGCLTSRTGRCRLFMLMAEPEIVGSTTNSETKRCPNVWPLEN